MSKGETFVSLFDKARRSCPNDECYISYDGDMVRDSISFQELWRLGCRFAYNLKQQGLEKGDQVVVATPLSLEYIVASFGVILAGGCHVSMEKIFATCEALKKTVSMTEAKFLVLTRSAQSDTWPFFEPKSRAQDGQFMVADYKDEELPSLERIVFTDKPKDDHDPRGFLNHLRKECSNEFRVTDLDPEDSCATGSSLNPGIATPKLIELSHRAVVNTARLWGRMANYGTLHTWFPWYISITLPHDALNGRSRIVNDHFAKMTVDPSVHHKRVIEAEGLQSSLMGPPDVKALADLYDKGDKKTLLKHIITGGQPVTKEIFETARLVCSQVNIIYFVSEANIVSCNSIGPGEAFSPFDAGFPVQGVEVRILGDDDMEVPLGETGRIAIRSPYQFTRYPGQDELTQSVWKDDGWFHSQDAGCLTADGHLHVYGRRGDVISRGIVLTYPSWIETPIWQLDDVKQVTVVPVPDEINFQNTCACVVLRPGSRITEADIHRKYQESITDDVKDLLCLDHVIIFEGGALPRLPRDQLGELAAEKLGIKKQSS